MIWTTTINVFLENCSVSTRTPVQLLFLNRLIFSILLKQLTKSFAFTPHLRNPIGASLLQSNARASAEMRTSLEQAIRNRFAVLVMIMNNNRRDGVDPMGNTGACCR
ncbi:hypothetical protein O6H91_02G092400 [Diphasiastrum complanatum]|uniref:Uncharacterized protein n=1 Tax=Diphasiastrum complanatum TaxID=34168 RepID=A0ACC2EI99_DIPCM|nr:hypothetical protein O6H91_02G092400 [Diphasiastrum complanatum]